MTAMSSVEYILKKCDLVEVELEGKFRKYTDNAKNIDSAIQIRTMLGNYINKCATVHAPYIRVDYLNSEVAFKSAYETLTNALTYANALDAKYFTFHPGF